MTRLKVGVVGSGIGASHIEAYQALPELYEVAALCDIDAGARPRRWRRSSAIPATVAQPRRAARRAISTSSTSARPRGCTRRRRSRCWRRASTSVVEKPVAKSLAEVDADRRGGGGVRPGASARSSSTASATACRSSRTCGAKGYAGAASVATAETHWFRGAAYYGQAAWRGTFDGELGGCLTTHAIHIHDILCEVLGPIASVHARTSRRLNGNETEDMAVLSLEFASRRLRHLLGHARLAAGDVAAALLLRRPRRRERPLALQPRPRSLDLPRRRSRGGGSASRRRWPTSRRCRSASSASSTGCTRR